MTKFIKFGYIDKEKDRESKLGDHGVRKYDYEIGRFTSVDPLFEKFHGWSPYNYSFNNPINFKDINGKDAVAIVNGDNITIKANYNVSNYSADQISAMGAEINNFLNNQNYVVSTGDYAGKNVKFDLIFFEAGTGGEFTIPQDVQGINIMNTIDQRPNGTYENVPHNQMIIDFRKTDLRGGQYKVNGGVTRSSKDIYMNAAFDNLRNRIHEIFHTFFYNNDNGATGIHNYVPGTDMPNQDDIDNMINNESLPKITN